MRPVSTLRGETVTFFFSDVEGSTRLTKALGDARWADLLEEHRRLVRGLLSVHGGREVDSQGDTFFVTFPRATDAALAAAEAQQALEGHPWPEEARVRIRIGLHTGEAVARNGRYVGQEVHRASRICDAGHGGQIVLSQATAELVRQSLPEGASLTDLGAHRLKDLGARERLFQLAAEGLPSEFPRLRSLSASHNLPAERTSFIGREDEIRTVTDLLGQHRLVTLTGSGGAGKTRLAVRVGREEVEHFADGVFFIDLAAVTNGADVPAAVAAALGLVLIGGDGAGQIASYLSDKAVLVILDNCEHLVDSCADFVAEILDGYSDSKLLATSREALDIDGEHVVVLPSLDADSPDAPSVRLFLDRATAVAPGLTVTSEDLGTTIVEICTRLDGMPLAIELAAARSTVLSPAELLDELDDRFRVLAGGRRRQRRRTLEATLDWSWDLLEPEEQQVFRALGVFVDGFDLVSVAAVASVSRVEALDLIEALVTKSLVVRADIDEEVRFRLLESMKAYAEHRLEAAGELAPVRRRHLEHFHRIASVHGIAPLPERGVGIRLRYDVSNVTAAFELAVGSEDWEAATELISGAMLAYESSGRTSARSISTSVGRPRDEAKVALEARLKQVRLGTYCPPTQLPILKDVAEKWLENKADRRTSTRYLWENHVHVHILPRLGEVRVDRITPPVVEEALRNDLLRQGRLRAADDQQGPRHSHVDFRLRGAAWDHRTEPGPPR